MINNNNSPNTINTNVLAAKRIEARNESRREPIYVQAPQSLPKYSITQKMEEADAFRKNVITTNYEKKEKKKGLKRFIAVAAMTIAGLIGYKYFKKS